MTGVFTSFFSAGALVLLLVLAALGFWGPRPIHRITFSLAKIAVVVLLLAAVMFVPTFIAGFDDSGRGVMLAWVSAVWMVLDLAAMGLAIKTIRSQRWTPSNPD